MENLQPQMVPGQYNYPVIMNTQPQPVPKIARYAKTFNKLGISQIVLGVISMVIGILLIILASTADNYYWAFVEYVAPGIWCGVLFVTSGILGRVSAKKQNTCSVTGGLVMSIFSILAAATLLSLEIIGAAESDRHNYLYPNESYTHITVFHSILCILAFAEFVIAITHSAYCCAASTCCCAENTNQQQIIVTTGNTNPMMHNNAFPVQVGYVAQPRFGTTVQLQAGSYFAVNNNPVGVISNNNRITAENSTIDLPPQYQDLKNVSQPQ